MKNKNIEEPDIEIMLQTLRYAARQIVSDLDPEILAYHALEMVADFSHSNYLSLILINENTNSIYITANLKNGEFSAPKTDVTWIPILKKVYDSKKICTREVDRDEYCLFLDMEIPYNKAQIYCLPLIGTNNKVGGFIVLLVQNQIPLTRIQEEILAVLTTMIATTIENVNLFQMATTDGLTGLYVRRYFDIRLQEEIARLNRTESSLALVMTDIDHFKKINDNYGHQQGDVILQELAKIFRNIIRKDLDIPCRYGGEEFVVILPSTKLEGAIVFAERLRIQCENYLFPYEKNPLHVTLSGGVVSIDSGSNLTKDDLVKAVDQRLYEAKASGRNCIKY